MEKRDIVIVGGSAAGLTAAVTARRHYPDKRILVIRREGRVPIPCGIPYIFGTLGSAEDNAMSDAPYEANDVELKVAEVTDIDRRGKSLRTDSGSVRYDRLVLATGSAPVVPPIPGIGLKGVFAVQKDFGSLKLLAEHLRTARNIVVIGGGFIGVEMADEINKTRWADVTIVEAMPRCLNLAYDNEFCAEMEAALASRGIAVKTSMKVEGIRGAGRVESVRLSEGSEVEADTVVLGIGAAANVDLAKKAGLRVGPTGGVAVDPTMATSSPDIFACGDCAEKMSFFGGGPSALKLASVAQTEARIAAANLFVPRRRNHGTVGAWATRVGDLAIGGTGLTEAAARADARDMVVAVVEGPDRHPGGMPGASPTKVKAVFDSGTGVVLGVQVRGGAAVGEMVNAASVCVQRRMTAEDVAVLQIGTHPALTASPVVYPLVNVAEIAAARMR